MRMYKVVFTKEYNVEAIDESEAIERVYPMFYSDVTEEVAESNDWNTKVIEMEVG
jgi:hypothetical protein